MDNLRQALYLIADEMRGMATIGDRFAHNVYETERAHRIMELAAKVAALAGGQPLEQVRALFEQRPWLRFSPAIGVEAAVFNPQGELLLIQRRDNKHWALPGGVAEIGRTLAESALYELWEEAGLRGQVVRLMGVFDGRWWKSRASVHLIHVIFQVECSDLSPSPGLETLEAAFFDCDHLPAPLHPGHDLRVPCCFDLPGNGAFFDPADSRRASLPMYQRLPALPPDALDHAQSNPPPGGNNFEPFISFPPMVYLPLVFDR
ncbi:MAG: NUDIX hydrolase N-terminal domain-containing protein [Anaerolineae bacterium]|nr:NUDIX hydrolase N-terminal domain-containing protein [Anaerolineae bacterium]